jgi:UrcA family protein
MTRMLIAAAIATIVLAPAANAAPHQIAVAIGDLDLGTPVGQAELASRLHAAAASLCSPALSWDNPGSQQSVRESRVIYAACIGRLTDRAMAGIKTGRN